MKRERATNMAKGTKGLKLVIVESPTKAKTIRKFLGKDYVVESCFGHIRDLPRSAKDIPEKLKKEKWATLGVDVEHGFAPIYFIPKEKLKVVKTLKALLKDADEVFLATDEDREGESISWHLVEVLDPKVPIKRMVFHEITKEAIQKALTDVRQIDQNLVKAQEARRVLDRLVGYTISPLIWKKVAYGLSAGRVQSVAVGLVCEREHERLRFHRSEYWDLQAHHEKQKVAFESRLTSLDGKRVASSRDFDAETGDLKADKDVVLLDQKKAVALEQQLTGQQLVVKSIEEKPVSRKPAPPFITSTLQQEANRKLGLSSRETMQVAQKLYEQGFITYMRTDSTFLSQQALNAARNWIKKKYGSEYLPAEAKIYAGKKVKGAQEAHEAIRPAGTEFVAPQDSGLSGQQFRLYELIWMRTVACQMVDARQKQVAVRLTVEKAEFSASGMSIEFPGFLRAYVEGSDDPETDLQNREVALPTLKVGESVSMVSLKAAYHETKPPARYTEASLVQKLEKEGVGRPSTYASIMSTIQDRGYVKKVGNALAPTFTAMVVSKLLSQHLPEYVDPGFTSEMESSLDTIADGEQDSTEYLNKVYFGKKGLLNLVADREVKIDAEEARGITLEGLENFSFRVGRYGAYVSTHRDGVEVNASVPESETPGDMTADAANKLIDQKINGADALGIDPETGEKIYILTGRYGPYVQLGEIGDEDKKVKRVSLPPGATPETLSLEQAQFLIRLPLDLGQHPELNKPIKAGLGRFGPYVVCDGDFRSIPKEISFYNVDRTLALELLAQPKKGRGRRSAPLKQLGEHPQVKDLIDIMDGPYGPYLKCGKINVSLPEGVKPEDVTLDSAVKLLAERIEESGAGAKKTKSVKVTKKTAGTKKQSKLKPKSDGIAQTVTRVVKRRRPSEASAQKS